MKDGKVAAATAARNMFGAIAEESPPIKNGLISTSTGTVIIEAPSLVPTDNASTTSAISTETTTTPQ